MIQGAIFIFCFIVWQNILGILKEKMLLKSIKNVARISLVWKMTEMLDQHSRLNFSEKPVKFAQNHEEKNL